MDKYFYALGRRKTAGATARVFKGKGVSTINGKPVEEVYSSKVHQNKFELPFITIGEKGNYHFTAKTSGGGKTGAIGATVLAIARALVKENPEFKSPLRKEGLLTRDARMVERKKTGLKKARRSPQFSKR